MLTSRRASDEAYAYSERDCYVELGQRGLIVVCLAPVVTRFHNATKGRYVQTTDIAILTKSLQARWYRRMSGLGGSSNAI